MEFVDCDFFSKFEKDIFIVSRCKFFHRRQNWFLSKQDLESCHQEFVKICHSFLLESLSTSRNHDINIFSKGEVPTSFLLTVQHLSLKVDRYSLDGFPIIRTGNFPNFVFTSIGRRSLKTLSDWSTISMLILILMPLNSNSLTVFCCCN